MGCDVVTLLVTRLLLLLLMTCAGLTSCELLQNGGFEQQMRGWHCWGIRCEVLGQAECHDGAHAIRTHNRTQHYQGPSQLIHTVPGRDYRAQSWVRLLNDHPATLGQTLELEVSFHFADNTNKYINIAMRPLVTTKDGWILLKGEFQAPQKVSQSTKFYYQGPVPGVDYAVDQASVTEVTPDNSWRNQTDEVINRIRKSEITLRVTTDSNIDLSALQIQVLQTRKSFPFGTVVNSWGYVDPNQGSYRDYVHRHFNWAVPGNALKWRQLDWHQKNDDTLYARALDTVKGLRNAGLKVRGHNMVWSVAPFIPNSVKAQSGDQLRATVRRHIEWTLNQTRGLLEHWDVNNENLHGQWFQERLHDRDYDLELFRMMYRADPHPKLFLNDYNVVAQGAATSAYLAQAQRFKQANVHLYGLGVQCHFHEEQQPNPSLMKERLDSLASVGVPIWATEVDVKAADENDRADYIERALRALYGHPTVEGIMFWGILADSPSDPKALFAGNQQQPTAGGRRLLDLLENQWMTDETHTPSRANDSFVIRGFHGDYELHVHYQGRELSNLQQTFTLRKSSKTVNLHVHV